MTTRLRAIIISTISAFLLFLALVDTELFSYESIARRIGLSSRLSLTVLTALIISIVVTLGVAWVLFFKRKGSSPIAIMLFPGFAIFPYVLIVDSFTTSVDNLIGAGATALVAALAYWLLVYLLILTANVLNGAVLYNIPLGQAGKAAQFIFSLVSLYLIIGFAFSVGLPLEVRVAVVMLFTLYFSFSTIWALQIPMNQVITSSVAICLLMVLLTIVLSVWPVSSLYSTLAATVAMYILLNLALEMREHISRMVWVEYALLIFMVLLILASNSFWGINGAITF